LVFSVEALIYIYKTVRVGYKLLPKEVNEIITTFDPVLVVMYSLMVLAVLAFMGLMLTPIYLTCSRNDPYCFALYVRAGFLVFAVVFACAGIMILYQLGRIIGSTQSQAIKAIFRKQVMQSSSLGSL
jgi:hypothetical protein